MSNVASRYRLAPCCVAELALRVLNPKQLARVVQQSPITKSADGAKHTQHAMQGNALPGKAC